MFLCLPKDLCRKFLVADYNTTLVFWRENLNYHMYIHEQSILKILPINCYWCSCNLCWCDERYFLPFPQQKILLWHLLYNMLIKLVFIRVFFSFKRSYPQLAYNGEPDLIFATFFLKWALSHSFISVTSYQRPLF